MQARKTFEMMRTRGRVQESDTAKQPCQKTRFKRSIKNVFDCEIDGMIDLFWFGSNHYLENPSAGGIIELSALVEEQSHIHEGEEIHIISVKPDWKQFQF